MAYCLRKKARYVHKYIYIYIYLYLYFETSCIIITVVATIYHRVALYNFHGLLREVGLSIFRSIYIRVLNSVKHEYNECIKK